MNPQELSKLIDERLEALPSSVHIAIESIEIEKILQALAKKYSLHLDVWSHLEEEVLLTLLDIHQPEDMAHNIATNMGVEAATAEALVGDIAEEVFLPIRESLQSQTKNVTSPKEKRAPSDTLAYKAGESSAVRKDVVEDPYRESIDSL